VKAFFTGFLTVAVLSLAVIGQPGELVNMVSKWDFEENALDRPLTGFSFRRTKADSLTHFDDLTVESSSLN
jgi:hypothetical protein